MLPFSTEQRVIETAIASEDVDLIWLRPALHMIARRADRPTAITPDVDKACDAENFVNEQHSMDITPHAAQYAAPLRSTDQRTARQPWRQPVHLQCGSSRHSDGKTVARQEKTSFRDRDHVALAFATLVATRTLARLSRLIVGRRMATMPALRRTL